MASGRFVVVVLDSLGIGELPDAEYYGDVGSNTLGNLAEFVGGVKLPFLERMGLGKIKFIKGLSNKVQAIASFGILAEKAPGKDSITGHWELMGYIAKTPQPTYPNGFPERVLNRLKEATGFDYIGNIAASGTEIIQRLGQEHIETGNPILYTSADSVLQIATHEEIISVDLLYEICTKARKVMTGRDAVGRVIARPFIGQPGKFERTRNRKDFSLAAPGDTVLDLLSSAGIGVTGIGKIEDLFAGRGLTNTIHTESNSDGLRATYRILLEDSDGLIFTNLVDFDMLWGHRNDPEGYYQGLQEVDRFVPKLLGALRPDDILVLTADHGCDPTTPSTDHSREYVPILIFGQKIVHDKSIGCRNTFADLGATIAEYFDIRGTGEGTSFLSEILSPNVN